MRVFGVRIWVVVGVVLLAAAGIVVLWFMYGRGPQPGDTLLHDDFSAPSSRWPAGATDGGFTSFDAGAYKVGVDPESSISALTDLDADESDVRVEAVVDRMPSAGQVLVGLACHADTSDRFYELVVSRAGQWVIALRPERRVLARGRFDTSILGSGAVALGAECTGGDAERPLRLALSVNGTVVGVAHDPAESSPPIPNGVGFVVVNGESDPVDVHFDDLRVTVA